MLEIICTVELGMAGPYWFRVLDVPVPFGPGVEADA